MLKSAGLVSVHKSRVGKNLLQEEKIAPPQIDGVDLINNMSSNLVATACPDTPRYVSIEYWWCVPFFLRIYMLCSLV